jgi:ubiquinone/menaquinone biosynthesis C-methylase UbiE
MISLLRLRPHAAVLDLCCGPGRHSLALAQRGFHVTGVDIRADYLEQARQQAESQELAIEFVQADMRQFCRPEAFDAAINLYTSFGYFEDPDEDHQVLTQVHRSLRDGGALLINGADLGKEILARTFQERTWHEQDGMLLLEERKISRNWTWYERHGIVLTAQGRQNYRFAHRVYSAAEIAALLTESGFRAVEISGGLDGAPYDHVARRLVAVARK